MKNCLAKMYGGQSTVYKIRYTCEPLTVKDTMHLQIPMVYQCYSRSTKDHKNNWCSSRRDQISVLVFFRKDLLKSGFLVLIGVLLWMS